MKRRHFIGDVTQLDVAAGLWTYIKAHRVYEKLKKVNCKFKKSCFLQTHKLVKFVTTSIIIIMVYLLFFFSMVFVQFA